VQDPSAAIRLVREAMASAKPGRLTPVACWAHARRKLNDAFQADEHHVARHGVEKAPAQSPLAEALRYAVKLKPQLLTYTEDGRLEIDENPAENPLREICQGDKNWLFAGADCDGERPAAMPSLIETAKLNGVNPQKWPADVLDRIGKGHPINREDELLPWNWEAANWLLGRRKPENPSRQPCNGPYHQTKRPNRYKCELVARILNIREQVGRW